MALVFTAYEIRETKEARKITLMVTAMGRITVVQEKDSKKIATEETESDGMRKMRHCSVGKNQLSYQAGQVRLVNFLVEKLGGDLRYFIASNVDLTAEGGINLSEAMLQNTVFQGSNLKNAKLMGSILTEAVWNKTCLEDADLSGLN